MIIFVWLLALMSYVSPLWAVEQSAGLRIAQVVTRADETITVALWYPSSTPERAHKLGPYSLNAALNAEPLPGARPLVVLSHGTGGMYLNHHELSSALAKAGFWVASLTHPGDNHQDRALAGKPAYFVERPRQVSRMLDAILKDPEISRFIDAKRIGFVGHSAGGYTGAALLGAAPSIAATVQHCAQNYDDDPWYCKQSGSKERAISMAANSAHLPSIPASPDSRIRAAVLIAPLGAVFTDQSLATIKAPVRLFLAARDEVLVPRFHGERLAKHIATAQSTSFADGGHYMMVSKLDLSVVPGGAEMNTDPPGFDREQAIAAAGKEISSWFETALR